MTDIPAVPDIPFDQGEYDRVASEIRQGLQAWGDSILPGLGSAVAGMANFVLLPGWVIQAAVDAINALVEFLKDVVNFLIDLVEAIAAPILFYVYAWGFKSAIRGCITDAQGRIVGLPIAGTSDPIWQGAGATSYKGTVPKQDKAYAKAAEASQKLGATLGELAGAGLMLYLAVATLIATFSGGVTALAAEICSVLGIPAAPPTAIALSAVVGALLAGIKGLLDYINNITNKFADVDALANDNSSFPGGKWPVAVNPGAAGVMDDGSVADGDSDWSVPAR